MDNELFFYKRPPSGENLIRRRKILMYNKVFLWEEKQHELLL